MKNSHCPQGASILGIGVIVFLCVGCGGTSAVKDSTPPSEPTDGVNSAALLDVSDTETPVVSDTETNVEGSFSDQEPTPSRVTDTETPVPPKAAAPTATSSAAAKKTPEPKKEPSARANTASVKKTKPQPVNKGRASYSFTAKNGNINFSHSAHKSVTTCKNCHHGKEKGVAPPACRSCHGKGKGPSFKDVSHKLCKNCHKTQGMPTGCKSCHQK